MNAVTFITGNPHKAVYMTSALGAQVGHYKLELEELQSLELKEIVAHKATQAYAALQKPVLTEDVSLEFHALGRLPGPFIKWFIQQIGNQRLCTMLSAAQDRAATARVCYALFDGEEMLFFQGSMPGKIALEPRGENGFGWDQIFIRDGQNKTRAELDDTTEKLTSMRRAPLDELRDYIKAKYAQR